MKTQDYIPKTDKDFDTFQGTIWDNIVAHQPGTASAWGYPQQRVNAMGTKKNRWDAAWLIAKNKKNRTSGDVIEKDEAREDFEKDIRNFVNDWLAFNDLITDKQRTEMGLHIRDTQPTAHGVLNFAPSGTLDKLSVLEHILRILNPNTPHTQAMPDANRAEIQLFIGAANTLPAAMVFSTYRLSGRFLVKILFAEADRGKTAFYRTRYINRRGDAGPFGNVFSAVIA